MNGDEQAPAPEEAAAAEEAPEADAAAEEGTATEATEDEMERLRRDMEALNDRHLRLAAEFDNYRKRHERERVEHRVRSQAELVVGLLEVLDDLERVEEYDTTTAKVESFVEGVRLVERKLRTLLETAGLELVDVEDQRFDPATMDAMMTVPTTEPEEDDLVADVFQKGYRFKDILVRPARVGVKKYDPEAGS
ncbi:MAG: nucleotide exchange factor GrpE [Gemmatimonadota bacterium]